MIVSRPFKKVRSVNSSEAAYTAPVCEIDLLLSFPTDPATAAGRVIIPLSAASGGVVPNKIEVWPYGVGAAADSYTMRLIGWRRVLPVASGEPRQLWVPGLVFDATVILGTFAGLAGFPVVNTELFANTITMTNPNEPTRLGNSLNRDGITTTFTFANNTPARIQAFVQGFEAIEFRFANAVNTPTKNALYTFVDGTD